MDNYDRLDYMKERSESLRSAREEKRKQVAEEKLYEHFRQNCPDRKSTRLNSSHQIISYAVFCLKKKKNIKKNYLKMILYVTKT